MKLPLAGIRVLDLSMVLAGPFLTQILADHGAEVIKVEALEGERGRWLEPMIAGQSATFFATNRNKKSITLNLQCEEGRKIFQKLASASDIVVHAFRPGVMEKMGLSYNEIKKVNQRIIYCALSGFGADGPWQERAAHDLNIISTAGISGLTGTIDNKPAIPSVSIASNAGGSLQGVIAILMALINRQRTGQGQYCDISMMDGALSLMAVPLANWSATGHIPQMGQTIFTGGFAYYNMYETSDHRYISVAPVEAKFWRQFCAILGKPEYVDIQLDPKHQNEMIEGISAIFKSKSQDEWLAIFADHDICVTPVLNLEEAANHVQSRARNMVVKLENFRESGKDLMVTGLPIKYSQDLNSLQLTFPELGEHTTEILALAGYSDEEIDDLRSRGIV